MLPTVPIAMAAWIPLVLALFAFLPARRAMTVALIGGWLFLPVAEIRIQGLPDVNKLLVTCGAALLAMLVWDGRRLLGYRPRLLDVPVALFCLSPMVTALRNGQGAHEAVSVGFWQGVRWALPFLIGRLYFHDRDGQRALARGIFLGGMVYVPLCLYEMVAGPQLHRMLYGYFPHNLEQAFRLGGWRPTVFQHMGIMTALWMTAATLSALWLYRQRPRIVAGLALVTIAMRSVNAWVLLALGSALLWLSVRARTPALVLVFVLAIPALLGLRVSGVVSGQRVVDWLEQVSPEKAKSLRYRMVNEDIAVSKLEGRAWWGLGRGGHLLSNPRWPLPLVLDSLWVLVYEQFGAVGLAGLLGTLLAPVLLFLRAVPAARWQDADVAPAALLAVIVTMVMADNLFNDMGSPVYTAAAGGLAAFSADLLRGQGDAGQPQPAADVAGVQR